MTALYLTENDVASCMDDGDVLTVVRDTMIGLGKASPDVINGMKFGLDVPDGDGHMHVGGTTGYNGATRSAGLKWYSVADSNAARGLPRVPAYILVTDSRTGLLQGVVEGTALTSLRSAAMGVVGAMCCARRAPRTVAVLGGGQIGGAALRLLAREPQIETLRLIARSPDRARPLVDRAMAVPGRQCTIDLTDDTQAAVADADMVVTATSVEVDSDLVRAAWLKADAVVCSLGSRREVDHDLIRTAWMALDDRRGIAMRRPDFQPGGVAADKPAAFLCEVVAGVTPPAPDGGQVFLISSGMGAVDIALAGRALELARQRGLGMKLAG